MTSRTVSNHVLVIMSEINTTHSLSEEKSLRVSVELHKIIDAIRHGCEVLRNPGPGPDDQIVDAYLKTLRCQDILPDPSPLYHTEIKGGHDAPPHK